MEKIITTNQVWWVYSILLLYGFLLFILIVRELRNDNSKKVSFLWIIGSFLIPIVPFVYAIMIIIKKVKHYWLIICLCAFIIGCANNKKDVQGTWEVVDCIPEIENLSSLGDFMSLWMSHSVQGALITIDDNKWIVQDSIEYFYNIKKDSLFLKDDDDEVGYAIGWRKDTLSLTNKDITMLLTRQ